jgi:L-threonylcarbamoyladenylate synthase
MSDRTGINEALAVLDDGGVVAAATETFFGLLADVSRIDAVDRLFELKPRGADKGVPILLPGRTAWRGLVEELPPLAERLAESFWPGPLSIALAAASDADRRLTLDGTVAVRLPGASPAQELARLAGQPLTATSANLPGAPPPTRAREVRDAFGAAITDGRLYVLEGSCPGGRASTVVVVRDSHVRLARAGAIAVHDIERVAGVTLET